MDQPDAVVEDLPERSPVSLAEVIADLHLAERRVVPTEGPHDDHRVRPAA